MRVISLLLLVYFLLAIPAFAAETSDENADEHPWSAGFSAGVSIVEDASDQKFAHLSISRDFNDSYAGMSVTFVDSGEVVGLINAVPASTTEFTLSAGTATGAVSLDGYVSYGKRDFDTELVGRNGQTRQIDSDGELFGIGGSVSYDHALDDTLFLSPTLAIDYNEIDIARLAQGQNGQSLLLETSENGVTGTFGLALQKLFGSDDNHLAGLIGNVVTTSNTSSFNPGDTQSAVIRALAARDEVGQKDTWAEAGLVFSFALNGQLRLDLSAIRTIGFVGSDITSLAAGLRVAF